MAIDTVKAKVLRAAKTKLQQSRSFLEDMREQEEKAVGDRSRFDHYLSAFLTATMSVRGRFHVRQDRKRNEAIKQWKNDWEAQLTPEQKRIYDFLCEDRNVDVHTGEPRRSVKLDKIKIGSGSSYNDKSGTLEVWGSPSPSSPLMNVDLGATISKPRYVFDIDETERPVIDICAEYLMMLEQLVAQFESDVALPKAGTKIEPEFSPTVEAHNREAPVDIESAADLWNAGSKADQEHQGERARRRQFWPGLTILITMSVVGPAAGYFAFFWKGGQQSTVSKETWPPGWENLLGAGCTDTGSIDGTKELHLFDNQKAVLYVKEGRGTHRTDGSWVLDTTDNRYSVTLGETLTSYSIVAPERSGVCMLIKGEPNAADLRASWFALSTDIDPREFEDRERDTPGL
jgi:hypothetical protein